MNRDEWIAVLRHQIAILKDKEQGMRYNLSDSQREMWWLNLRLKEFELAAFEMAEYTPHEEPSNEFPPAKERFQIQTKIGSITKGNPCHMNLKNECNDCGEEPGAPCLDHQPQDIDSPCPDCTKLRGNYPRSVLCLKHGKEIK